MKPIIFNSEMIRAILEGRKTQTRRPLNQQPDACCYEPVLNENGIWEFCADVFPEELKNYKYKCPYGKVGDKLWVRETWHVDALTNDMPIEKETAIFNYKADMYWGGCTGHACGIKWKSSIHMPRWASRITLEITDIRVERLQEISEEDAKNEGYPFGVPLDIAQCHTYTEMFMSFWYPIYEDTEYTFSKNPWVWVIEFKRKEKK